jgi:acyl carrier protein
MNRKDQIRQYVLDNILMTATAASLSDETSFSARRLIDSTGFLELVSFLERAFQIEVRDDEMVPENLDYVSSKLASPQPVSR